MSGIKLPEAIENFCFAEFKNELYLMVANGPYISVMNISLDSEPVMD